jgi:Uridine kinase
MLNLMEDKYKVVINKIDQLLKIKDPIYVVIDGKCGGGKTTLATYLKDHYQCSVIHMDDFFLQPHQRVKERYQEAGGNVDYERFEKEVISRLKVNSTFDYQIFDCVEMKLSDYTTVNKNNLYVVEGSYSLNPYFSLTYDLKIFIDIDKDKQKERIIKRNVIEKYKMFEELWIPYENNYFDTFKIKELVDLIIDGA